MAVTIPIVEDEPITAADLEDRLTGFGYRVVTFVDQEEDALASARPLPPAPHLRPRPIEKAAEREYLATKTLTMPGDLLPAEAPFMRCYRSYIVNLR